MFFANLEKPAWNFRELQKEKGILHFSSDLWLIYNISVDVFMVAITDNSMFKPRWVLKYTFL